jgi:hypothetical protein
MQFRTVEKASDEDRWDKKGLDGVCRWHRSDLISSLVSFVFFVAGGLPVLEESW